MPCQASCVFLLLQKNNKKAVILKKDDGAICMSWCHLDLFKPRQSGLKLILPGNGGDRWRLSRWLAGGFPFQMAAALHRPAVLCCQKKVLVPFVAHIFIGTSIPVPGSVVNSYRS